MSTYCVRAVRPYCDSVGPGTNALVFGLVAQGVLLLDKRQVRVFLDDTVWMVCINRSLNRLFN